MSQPLLEGEVDDRESIILGLREKNRQLAIELQNERGRAGNAEAGVKELRRILSPLHNALRLVFGEIDGMDLQDLSTPSNGHVQGNPKWDSWKQKLGGKPAEFIAELLVHGEMTGKQLMVATKCGQDAMYGAIKKLNQAQLLNKNGGRFSLKEI